MSAGIEVVGAGVGREMGAGFETIGNEAEALGWCETCGNAHFKHFSVRLYS